MDIVYNLPMNINLVFKLLRFAAVFGNVVFVLWILYNAIDEGFQGTRIRSLLVSV